MSTYDVGVLKATAAYDALKDLANVAEAGGLAQERSVLLLWVLRSIKGVDDFQAYEFVCDGTADGGIDGLMLEEPTGESDVETLWIMQSKYPQGPSRVGRTALDPLIAAAAKFQTAAGLTAFLSGQVNKELRSLIKRFDLEGKLASKAVQNGKLRLRLLFVTAGLLDGDAQKAVVAQNALHGPDYLTAYDLRTLGPIAQAVTRPVDPSRVIDVASTAHDRLIIGTSPNRVLVFPVQAVNIVQWAGIADRTLFDLNVRRELPTNLVRRQLDDAIHRPTDHPDFIAYHNGLTITCKSFELRASHVRIVAPSVVNGAQSVIAFHDASSKLTGNLSVLVKVVETSGRPELAEQVSRRSNTQNPVNPRNLVANTLKQRSLAADFDQNYPKYYYETKPDTHPSAASAGRMIIQNDDAAQLLCAIFVQEPWLAVKKTSLFEPENHPRVFGDEITAAHVIVANEIAQAIDLHKARFPKPYRSSWRLTRLIATYVLGQLLRAGEPNSDERRILDNPKWAVKNLGKVKTVLAPLARYAATAMKVHHDECSADGGFDDFKVDFKRRDALVGLKNEARKYYAYLGAGKA